MSGQNKRINNSRNEINRIIQKYSLNYDTPICFVDESGNLIDDGREAKYDDIIVMASELIGELKGLSLPSSNHTAEKQEQYKNDMELLKERRNEMQEKKMRQYRK